MNAAAPEYISICRLFARSDDSNIHVHIHALFASSQLTSLVVQTLNLHATEGEALMPVCICANANLAGNCKYDSATSADDCCCAAK